MILDPTEVRLSKHFLLSDFMGSSKIYARGLANQFEGDLDDPRLRHGRAFCEMVLEPLLEKHGPASISYGFISPEVSQQIVNYMNPNDPSYHRWDLGAAADLLFHDAVPAGVNGFESAPVMLAHKIERDGTPYSRMITYSESEFICLSANADEIDSWYTTGKPTRRAFYENRYEGKPGARPKYVSMATDSAKARAHAALVAAQAAGEAFDWRGTGSTTYHGTKAPQLHHKRISRYTMATDWLFDVQSIAKGASNQPAFGNQNVCAAFAAAGKVYDRLLDETSCNRYSIVGSYVSHTNPLFPAADELSDWRNNTIGFWLAAPNDMAFDETFDAVEHAHLEAVLPGVVIQTEARGTLFSFEVDNVNRQDW